MAVSTINRCCIGREARMATYSSGVNAGHGFLREGDPVNAYPFIEAEKVCDHNVKRACELLEVSRAAYYAQRTDQPSARVREDAELTEQITDLHAESRGRYGAPRITPSYAARAGGTAGSESPG